MNEMFLQFKDFYWANREAFRLGAAGTAFVLAQLTILLWTLRRLQELSNIRERLSRLADGLALLTDTTEAGLSTVVQQIAQLEKKSKPVRPASRASLAKRIAAAARTGEHPTKIAQIEALSESEVRLHIAMANRDRDEVSPAPLAS